MAANRLVELGKIRQASLNITIPPPDANMYTSKTLGQLVSLFLAAGAISPLQWNVQTGQTPSLPDANSTALGDLRTNYNMVRWTGNTTSYLQVSG